MTCEISNEDTSDCTTQIVVFMHSVNSSIDMLLHVKGSHWSILTLLTTSIPPNRHSSNWATTHIREYKVFIVFKSKPIYSSVTKVQTTPLKINDTYCRSRDHISCHVTGFNWKPV